MGGLRNGIGIVGRLDTWEQSARRGQSSMDELGARIPSSALAWPDAASAHAWNRYCAARVGMEKKDTRPSRSVIANRIVAIAVQRFDARG